MFYRICLFSETVCDKGATFLRNRSSDNIEGNTKTLFNENETRLLRKIVYGVLRPFQQYFSYIVAVSFIVEETGVPGENHRPAASHWQTLSHNVISSTPKP
jgi:hypothetical protein